MRARPDAYLSWSFLTQMNESLCSRLRHNSNWIFESRNIQEIEDHGPYLKHLKPIFQAWSCGKVLGQAQSQPNKAEQAAEWMFDVKHYFRVQSIIHQSDSVKTHWTGYSESCDVKLVANSLCYYWPHVYLLQFGSQKSTRTFDLDYSKAFYKWKLKIMAVMALSNMYMKASEFPMAQKKPVSVPVPVISFIWGSNMYISWNIIPPLIFSQLL